MPDAVSGLIDAVPHIVPGITVGVLDAVLGVLVPASRNDPSGQIVPVCCVAACDHNSCCLHIAKLVNAGYWRAVATPAQITCITH